VQPGRHAVDAVPVQSLSHLVEVLFGELLGVVELVVVDQVAEAVDGTVHALGRRIASVRGLIADRHETGDHRPKGPYTKTRLHVFSFPAPRNERDSDSEHDRPRKLTNSFAVVPFRFRR